MAETLRVSVAAATILSYILRLWAEGPPEARVWRVSLTPISGGERLGFADLKTAFQFLTDQIEMQGRSDNRASARIESEPTHRQPGG